MGEELDRVVAETEALSEIAHLLCLTSKRYMQARAPRLGADTAELAQAALGAHHDITHRAVFDHRKRGALVYCRNRRDEVVSLLAELLGLILEALIPRRHHRDNVAAIRLLKDWYPRKVLADIPKPIWNRAWKFPREVIGR